MPAFRASDKNDSKFKLVSNTQPARLVREGCPPSFRGTSESSTPASYGRTTDAARQLLSSARLNAGAANMLSEISKALNTEFCGLDDVRCLEWYRQRCVRA